MRPLALILAAFVALAAPAAVIAQPPAPSTLSVPPLVPESFATV